MSKLLKLALPIILLLLLGYLGRSEMMGAVLAAETFCNGVSEIPLTECQALEALYNSTDGASWSDNSGWLTTTTPCSWYGVTCSEGHVTRVNLSTNQLSGSIPTELANLPNLTHIYLYNNELSGSIPTQLGNLSSLEQLELYTNQLSGSIPSQLGNLSSLRVLYLHNNQLEGTIPSSLGNLSNLTHLYLLNNHLSGSIPSQLGNLSSLRLLHLHNNQLEGPIPTSLGNLTNLTHLYLHNNQLSGSIPSELANLSNVRAFYLSTNQLEGAIPTWLGNFTNLTHLYLSSNHFSGSIPTQLANLTNLQVLYLSDNQLSGSIPNQLGTLTNLTHLYLHNNQLSGSIPPELANLSHLRAFYLYSNQLEGAIPTWLGNFTNLTHLYLHNNHLSGAIPTQLGNLSNLKVLYLSGNQLSGSIPSQLGNLSNLTHFYLSSNQLSGTIPSELANLSHLRAFYLSTNQLSGAIPTWLGNFSNLTHLYLHTNQFSGTIPSQLTNLTNLTHLYLNNNHLSGTIPTQLGYLGNLEVLHLGDNQLSGSIPSAFGNLTNLTHLRLHNNELSGSISPELANLTNLRYLHLGGNQLSGTILSWLGNFANLTHFYLNDNQFSGAVPTELGNLSNLEVLHLKENQFSGSIPSELANLANLELLHLGGNQLSGSIPSGLGNLTHLTQLQLYHNQLSGSIPPEFANLTNLRYLHLGDNDLSGTIVSWLGNFTNLTHLYLYNNQLSGSVPVQLGNLSNLELLHLSGNQLAGSIPAELGNLAYLEQLQLYNNQLSGDIPAALSNLSNLSTLNLAYNMLQATDSTLIAWLNATDPDWANTQTVAATNLQVTATSSQTLQLTWTPIIYTGHSGYYQISYSTSSGGPYTIHGITANKSSSSYSVDNLSPTANHYFIVRTFTEAHDSQQNDLLSAPTAEVSSTLPTELSLFDVRTTNVRDVSFTISWLTNMATDGQIRYGTDPNNLNQTAHDTRGASTSALTHYLLVEGLEPETTYYFDVLSDSVTDNNGGAHYQITTAATPLSLPGNDLIYGQVKQSDGTTLAEGAIVIISLQDHDDVGSPNSAAPLSALVDSDGFWRTNLGNARLPDLSGYFSYSSSGDMLMLEAQSAVDASRCHAIDTANDAPADTIVLDNSPCTMTWQQQIDVGWNHISLGVESLTPLMAENLCDQINAQGGNALEIDLWRSGGWDGHVCQLPFNDFTLAPGAGYFVKSSSANIWRLEGRSVNSPVALELQTGWNSIAIPHTDAYTAESLCDEIIQQSVTAVEIDRWYNGGWNGHICGLPFNNFNIERGTGYFVKTTSSGTVTPNQPSLLRQADPSTSGCRACRGTGTEIAPLSPDPSTSSGTAGNALPVQNLRISNLRDTSLTLSWTTDEPTTGYVQFGEGNREEGNREGLPLQEGHNRRGNASRLPSGEEGNREEGNREGLPLQESRQVAYDTRGAMSSSTTHYVVLDNLTPDTTYEIELISGGEADQTISVSTAPILEQIPESDTIYGQAFYADGVTPAKGATVYLQLEDRDQQGSSGQAALISALVDQNGYWHANLGNARVADGTQPFAYSPNDRLTLVAQATGAQSVTQTLDLGSLPAAPLLLEAPWQLYLPLMHK